MKNSFVNFYRLIMAIGIMSFHSYHLDNIGSYPFKDGNILVEIFFMLTGYLTVYHFQKKPINKNEVIVESIKYTINKFIRFVPYVFVTTFTVIIIKHRVIANDMNGSILIKGILESLMLIRGNSNVGVIWYLTAMIYIFPLFCFLINTLKIRIQLLISTSLIMIVYVIMRTYPVYFPQSMLRAGAGLSLGIICFYLKERIERLEIRNTKLWNLIISVCLFCPLLFLVFNIYNGIISLIILFLYVLGFAMLFDCRSNELFWIKINDRFSYLCAKISFPLYIVHLPIADFIKYYSLEIYRLSVFEQYSLFFGVSVLFALLLTLVIDISKKLL